MYAELTDSIKDLEDQLKSDKQYVESFLSTEIEHIESKAKSRQARTRAFEMESLVIKKARDIQECKDCRFISSN